MNKRRTSKECISFEKLREDHRKEYSDLEWAAAQQPGPARFKIGDVVYFKAGGCGVINKVKEPSNGWPATYSTDKINGQEDHPKTKRAWHYEGDFEAATLGILHNFDE